MRHAGFALAFALLAIALPAPSAELTVVVDDGRQSVAPLPEPTFDELKRELHSVFRDSNVQLSVLLHNQEQRIESQEIVMVRLTGDCRMTAVAPYLDEQGPLAWTHTVNGQILPFSDIGCDRLRRAVSRALWGGQHKEKERLFGRALVRVIAHEIMHILGKTHVHSEHGLFREGLTSQQLVADRMSFDPQDLARLP